MRSASIKLAAVISIGICTSVFATFKQLSQKLPAQSNAVVAVNVAKLLETPYAKNEWTPTAADAWAKEPMMIPPGSTRLLMAAETRPDTMESIWECSVMELQPGKMPDAKTLAGA